MPAYRRYRRPLRRSTWALTARLCVLATIAALLIGGVIAAQMAAGSDPALGPKAAARAKKASAAKTGSSSATSSGTGSASPDPSYQNGYDGHPYGSGSSGYSAGSSGYGSSSQQYSPPPVTSSTS
jgi:hypothetical protein